MVAKCGEQALVAANFASNDAASTLAPIRIDKP